MKTTTGIAVFLILKMCLISVLSTETLPQTDLRELDIFMQEEEYMAINRIKRTDEDGQEEGDFSGDAQPQEQDPANTNVNAANNSTNNTIPSSNSARESPPAVVNLDTDMGNQSESAIKAVTSPDSEDGSVGTSIVEETDLKVEEENAEISTVGDIDASTEDENSETSTTENTNFNTASPSSHDVLDSSSPSEDSEIAAAVGNTDNNTDSGVSTNTTIGPEENENGTPLLEETTDMSTGPKEMNATESPEIEDIVETNTTVEIESPPPLAGSRSTINEKIPEIEANTTISKAAGSPNISDTPERSQDAPPMGNSSITANATDIQMNNSSNIEQSIPVGPPVENDNLPATNNSAGNSTAPGNSTVDTNTTDSDNSTQNVNNTITTETPGTLTNSTNSNSTGVVTTKPPTVGESDETKRSSVSGSGILFTVITLVAVAAVAAVAYIVYKKRRGGYDPVNVDEDQDKELIEIKPENGFGKPIMDHEVKLEDQITPTQPKPAPRTFVATPTSERKFDEFQARSEDREHSVDFQEEETKKNEQ